MTKSSWDAGVVDPGDLDARIALGGEAFARQDFVTARALLNGCAADPGATVAHRVEALNDLAVIASVENRTADTEQLLLSALAGDGSYLPALQNLGDWCAKHGDLVQATHWYRRATQSAPHDPAGWLQLAAILRERLRDEEAVVAVEQARAHGADVAVACTAKRDSASGGAPRPQRQCPDHPVARVLIVVDWFFPSVGGTERLAEAVGVWLQSHGTTVEVAARQMERRTSCQHRGMRIHQLQGDVRAGLTALVQERGYDVVLAFSNTNVWPVLETLRLTKPRPRVVVVPCVNAMDSARLRATTEVFRYADLMAGADVIGYSSHSGYDIRLWRDLGLDGIYVPNATERIAPALPSPTAAIPDDAPLLLMVANFWPEKNHDGLLRALRGCSRDWHLAIIGGTSPDHPHLSDDIRHLADADQRVHLLGPVGPPEVAAAMNAARILLLPSLAEATPLVLLEAMSRRLPWIATPTCGSAHDHAGGLILPLGDFGEGISFLLDNPEAARTLGAAGQTHWRCSYTWDVVGPRYEKMLRGETVPDMPAPAGPLIDTERVRAQFYDGRPATALRRSAVAA